MNRAVEPRQEVVDALHAEIFAERIARRTQSHNGAQLHARAGLSLDDAQIVELASRAKNGSNFVALFRDGDLSRHDNDHSKADLALFCMLLFYTGDSVRAEQIFSRSALAQRSKWGRRDYRERTIAAASQVVTEFYQPRRNGVPHNNVSSNSSSTVANDDHEPEVPVLFSDIALSNQFADEQGADLRYVRKFDRWYEYHENGGRWIEDRKLRIYTRVKRFLTVLARTVMSDAEQAAAKSEESEKILDAARKLAGYLTSAKKVHDVVSLTRSHGVIAAMPEQFDADSYLLNTPGGAVDLRSGAQRQARREDYFTKTTAVTPRNEQTPVFDQFMHEIMGWHISPEECKCAVCVMTEGEPGDQRIQAHRAEVRALGQYQLRVYGHSLSGDVSEHKLFLDVGEGGNGKGTLNDLMSRQVFGHHPEGYACEIPIEALLESKGERHPTDLMSLWHSRLALARESDEDTRWNESRVKRLTGGDRITARYMRQDFIEFDPTHTLIVFGQAKPVLSGADQAAWKRRLQIIPFPQLWDDQTDEAKGIRKRDTHLGEKLQQEAPGVLYKLIHACVEWYRERDLKAPLTVREASSNYLIEQSAILTFIAERYDRSDQYANTTVNEIWSEWVRWSEARNERPGPRRDFNAKLERAGIKIERTGAQRGICKGLQLKNL